MFLPKKIQKALEQNKLYVKIRYSKWIYSLWLLLRPDVRQEISAKRKFYTSAIPHGCKLIFDIGANEGVMTDIFGNLSKRVIAVEPAKRNVNILSAKFNKETRITIVPVAVSEVIGEQAWYEDENNYAMGTLNSKWNISKPNMLNATPAYISTTTLDKLIWQYGSPGFIKIDVEGNEWQALKGLSQPIQLLSFEAILPRFLDETILCIEHLLSLHSSAVFNYVTNNEFAYQTYQDADVLFNDIKTTCETVDIFCKM